MTRMGDRSIDFFETQFRRQVAEQDFALNPLEQLVLEYVSGAILDLGCGLGNLSLEAGRRVVAVDGSETAIARIQTAALDEKLRVEAVRTDFAGFETSDHL